MQINPFRIEQYFGKYEFTAKYLLSSSDAESRTIKELLDLEPGAQERLLEPTVLARGTSGPVPGR